MRIGITGQNGFIGTHLKNHLFLYKEEFEIIPFDNIFFDSIVLMDEFVSQCDVIIHLAAKNRHANTNILYQINIGLVQILIESLIRTKSNAHVIFSSSSQEIMDNLYGDSKREGRLLFSEWALKFNGRFTGLLIPNVFGPFGRPKYNSFIATFCQQIINGEDVNIDKDSEVKLIYVVELINEILIIIRKRIFSNNYIIEHTSKIKVSEVMKLLQSFNELYFHKNTIPSFNNIFELNIFNTFRSYGSLINNPVLFKQHIDERGAFVELIRLSNGGQVSFSTTNPGIIRGNHFHTRKIERFAVIKGDALIKLRRIGTSNVLEFKLSGDRPAFIDIPIWYTHNIMNIGTDVLYTVFWINEIYNTNDTDTFLNEV